MNFFKTKNGRIVLWIAAIIAIAAFLWLTAPKTTLKNEPAANLNNTLQPAINTSASEETVNANTNEPKIAAPAKKPAAKPVGFVEKRTPHFVSSSIANNATISAVPSHLTLNFDVPLVKSEQSVLTVKKNDITSATMNNMSLNDKSMVVRLNTQVVDGDYYVYYVACFADIGCKDGRFGYHLKLP